MIRPYEWMLARKYLRSRQHERFVSLIGWSSAVGIAIGVAALIVVLSVMYGFDVELKDRILGFSSHVDVQGPGESIGDWRTWLKRVKGISGVRRVAPYVQGQVLVSHGQQATGAIVKGVDPQFEGEAIARHVVQGRFIAGAGNPFQVILGKDLARKLGVMVGDQVQLMTSSAGIGPAGVAPRMRRFEVVGIFDSGFYEYDVGLILTSLEALQRLNRMGDAVTGLEVFADDRDQAPALASAIRARLPAGAWVTDWQQRHRSFFHALKTERLVMGIILSLIVLVAVFNMLASLVMTVMERRREIAILKTIGATHASIMRIFMCMGGLLCSMGTAAGCVLGLLLAWKLDALLAAIESLTGVTFLSRDVYYIDHVPSVIDPVAVTAIVLSSLAMGLLATLYPAWRASGVPPAEALRYE